MAGFIEIFVFSIIQGICEWFPVSSSGHLAIFHEIFGFQSLSFDVFLHFSSILAVLVIFRKEIIRLFNIKNKENRDYLLLLLIGIIPAGIVGVLFKNYIEGFFSSLFYLSIFFIISGILVYSTKFFNQKKEKIGLLDSLFIGIFQAIAILPGISRSGSTISAGLIKGIDKGSAIKFSFLMAIPLILGASFLELKDLDFNVIPLNLLIVSFILTFLISLFSIKVLMKIVKSNKFYLFGVYNFILGILILIWSLLK